MLFVVRAQCFLMLSLVAIVLLAELAFAKSTDKKLMPKKASSAKPTKGPKSLLDRFPNLSGDDIGFIKALDKQFTKYGGAVKIKVVNGTDTEAKNKKRTINGELGYGYYGQQQAEEQSYSFSKPKFQIYPYSQHDIPPLPSYQHQQAHDHYYQHQQYQQPQPQHYQPRGQNQHVSHSVQIQPSLSFELKHTEQGYEKVQPHQQQVHPVEHSVPVIVLRIPGPHKYAAHLQMLLQQYLEIRAAEYIKTLQDQEYHYQQQQQEPETQQHYQLPSAHDQHEQQEQQPQYHAHAQHQATAEPSYADYEENPHQYQAYEVQQREAEPETEEQEQSHTTQQQEDTYSPQQYQHQPAAHQQYGPPPAPHHEPVSTPVHENHPGKLHTQVIFTGHGNYADQSSATLKQKGYDGYQGQHAQPQYESTPRYSTHQAEQHQSGDYYEQQENETPQQGHHQHEEAHQHQAQPQYVYQYEQQSHSAVAAHPEEAMESVAHQHEAEEEEPADYVRRHLANQRSASVADVHQHSSYERPHNYHAHGQHPVSEARKTMSRY